MSRRYLFGPVSSEFSDQNLHRARKEGLCVAFNAEGTTDLTIGPLDDWGQVCARFPAGWYPDFIVLYLPYTSIPACLWSAPHPIVALAPDWPLLWHYYRQRAQSCDLVLTDTAGAEALAKEGIGQVRGVNLAGCERACLIDAPLAPSGRAVGGGGDARAQAHPSPPTPLPEGEGSNGRLTLAPSSPRSEGSKDIVRDIDILFVGNLNPAVQPERLPWLARLARLGKRWRVHIQAGVTGDAYRRLLRRARIVFNYTGRPRTSRRVFEATAAGALLFENAANEETKQYFQDRRECVYYRENTLESLLEYYLGHEPERQALAAAASQRVQDLGFEAQWEQIVAQLKADWEFLEERQPERVLPGPREDLLLRCRQAVSAPLRSDPNLSRDLEAALTREPYAAVLRNALGVVLTRVPWLPETTKAIVTVAAGQFRQAVAAQPDYLQARVNLVEALAAGDEKDQAIEEGRQALALLARLPELDAASLDGPLFQSDFGVLRMEWERAAWTHAGRPRAELRAKRELLRWHLHSILGRLTGDVTHYYEAYLARPDLPVSEAALGCALARTHSTEALDRLRSALKQLPFERECARALFHVLGALGDREGQRGHVEERRLLSRAAPQAVPAEAWFSEPPPRPNDLASIVILCCNELEYTRLCLESVLRCTRAPYELILVDNGSTDGTRAYLEELRGQAGPVRIDIIRNETNMGFPAGCNQGLVRARGRYLVLLNNDTVVTTGWLDGLLAGCLRDWPSHGLVGPVTNCAPDAQGIACDYTALDGLEAFAARRRQAHAGRQLAVRRLTGFCLLIRRDVYERVGKLDDRWGAGFFDDDDLCLRAREAGFGLAVALDVYIHHFGHRTFRALGIDTRQQLQKNFEIFREKWGAEHVAGYRILGPEPATRPVEKDGAPSSDGPPDTTDTGQATRDATAAVTAEAEIIERVPMESEALADLAVTLAAGQHDGSPRSDLNQSPQQGKCTPHAPREEILTRSVRSTFKDGSAPASADDTDNTRHEFTLAAEPAAPQPKMSLCMIVKNEENRLGACLESVRGLFDEINITDTGSGDRTRDVARSFGARVFEFPWCDSFAAARNECLRHATGRWIMWLDADDRVDTENQARLRALFDSLGNELAAYAMRVRSVLDAANSAFRLLDQVRLFPRRPQISWDYRVHEQILPGVLRLGGHVRWTDIIVDHVGYQDVSVRRGKLERNLRLLFLDDADRPDDSFTLFNLGWTLLDLGRTEEALPRLRRSLERTTADSSIARKLYHLLCTVQRQLGQKDQAMTQCNEGLARYPDDTELLFEQATMFMELQEPARAEANLLRLVETRPGKYFGSMDDGVRGHKTRDLLARHYRGQGRDCEAEIQWRVAVTERPRFAPGWLGLGDLYLGQKRWPEVDWVVQGLANAGADADAAILRSRACLERQEFAQARTPLETVIKEAPQAVGPRKLLTHILLRENNDLDAAERALLELLALVPEDAEARHNLGVLRKRREEAAAK